ncbi:MAG: peptidylprolyl isomerase [Bdellovibrionia bacterium]
MKNKVLFTFFFLLQTYAQAQVLDKVLAVVNNEPILASDVASLQKNINKPGTLDENIVQNIFNGANPKSEKEVLNYLIFEKLIASEVKRLGYAVTDERAEQEFRTVAKRARLSEEELVKALKEQGVNVDEYKQFLKVKIEKQTLLDSEIISKLRVSDEEAISEYEKKNPGKKISTKEFTLSHIFFNPKKGSPEAALERARVTREKLLSGTSFEKLAKENSEDPNFADGGRLGTFKSGDFMPELEEAVSTLKPGDTTGVVRSKIGFHILKLNNVNVIPDPRFSKEKDRIKESILTQAFSSQFKKWLESKREESFIHINQ